MRFLRLPSRFALLLALASALSASGTAAAAEPTPTEISVARRLFDEGRAAEDAGRWREAADKFRKATTIKDTPGMRFHLARCEEEQGAFVEALVEYDRARELIDGGIRAADVEKLLAEARERVRAKVALITLRLPDAVQNVSVELDGKPLAASVLGAPMPINPGKHRLQAVAVGRTTFSSQLELGTGEVRQLAIDLPVATTAPPVTAVAGPTAAAASAPEGPAPAMADKTAPRHTGRTIAVVTEASLAAVALTSGIVFTLLGNSADDRLRTANQLVLQEVGGSDPSGSACGAKAPPPGCVDLNQAQQDRSRDRTLAVVGFVGAGVSAAAIGLTYWLWPRGSAPAQVGAVATPGRFDLSVSGRF